jgi:hypothetical protein
LTGHLRGQQQDSLRHLAVGLLERRERLLSRDVGLLLDQQDVFLGELLSFVVVRMMTSSTFSTSFWLIPIFSIIRRAFLSLTFIRGLSPWHGSGLKVIVAAG